MDWTQALALALLQGATEFLPVSSSAHLALAPALLGWPDQGHVFDVAVHVGTLAALAGYFRRDLAAWLRAGAAGGAARREFQWLLLATAPILLAGPLLYELASTALRDVAFIAWTTLGFGVLLWLADARGARARGLAELGWGAAVAVGLAQCLALAPGVSRAGIVMTAALLLGLRRTEAARVAFLLALPTVAAAGALSAYKAAGGAPAPEFGLLLFGMLAAGGAAWLGIHFFLRLIERIGMLPFALYRVALGAVLLLFAV